MRKRREEGPNVAVRVDDERRGVALSRDGNRLGLRGPAAGDGSERGGENPGKGRRTIDYLNTKGNPVLCRPGSVLSPTRVVGGGLMPGTKNLGGRGPVSDQRRELSLRTERNRRSSSRRKKMPSSSYRKRWTGIARNKRLMQTSGLGDGEEVK